METAEEMARKIILSLPVPQRLRLVADMLESGENELAKNIFMTVLKDMASESLEKKAEKEGKPLYSAQMLTTRRALEPTATNDAEADMAAAHAAGYAEAVADVDALRAALTEARTVLSLCKTARIRGTPEYRMVSALGEELGYGAIMSAASSAWAAMFDGSPQEGSQHTCGPSERTVHNTIKTIDASLNRGAKRGGA